MDKRIDFICLDFSDIIEHMDVFDSGDSLDEKLDAFVSEMINAKVHIDEL
jgi:hypothetical protein